MKLTSSQLRKIIKEEITKALSESATEDAIRKKIAIYKTDPKRWALAHNEFLLASEGDDLGGEREEYYPGWTDEDFKKVIDAVQSYRRGSISR